MISLLTDSYGRNVLYDPKSGTYIVYQDPSNTMVALTVQLPIRDDARAFNTINSMAPAQDTLVSAE